MGQNTQFYTSKEDKIEYSEQYRTEDARNIFFYYVVI